MVSIVSQNSLSEFSTSTYFDKYFRITRGTNDLPGTIFIETFLAL